MDCPLCPTCHEYTQRTPAARLSAWAPLVIIVAVLGAAAVASAMTDGRDAPREKAIAVQGRAL